MQAATFAGAMTPVEWQDEPRTLRVAAGLETMERVDPRVPYDALEQAIVDAWAAYPLATNIVALWTPTSTNDVCVEVWMLGGRARVIAADRIGKVVL